MENRTIASRDDVTAKPKAGAGHRAQGQGPHHGSRQKEGTSETEATPLTLEPLQAKAQSVKERALWENYT